jgi:hypothetical protein
MKTGRFIFFFWAGACLLGLPLKLVGGWNAEPRLLLLSSWVADSCVLFWLMWLSLMLDGRRLWRRLSAGAFFLLVFLPALLTTSAHAFYLEEAAARQFSLLDASFDAVAFFIKEVVPAEVIWGTVGIGLALAAASWLLKNKLPLPGKKPLLFSAGALSLLALLNMLSCNFYPSVWWEMGRDLLEAFSLPPASGKEGSAILEDARRGRRAIWSEGRFDRVIVLVMESVPRREFEERLGQLGPEFFLSRELQHAHIYTNYLTTNQDSRTGLLAMLFGSVIPYEAYSEREARRYLFLKERPSILENLSRLGYFTAVAASQTDVELVVFELPWKKMLILSQEEFSNPGKFLCFNPYKFEHDCEDKILLRRIVEEISGHLRVFLLQEGVYGHIPDYYEATGKSSVQYYGEHLEELTRELERRGLWENTLLVVTSDHGIRDWDWRRRLWTYRLPLIFINPSFSRREISGLYNQSDFPALLAVELSGAEPPPARRASVFVGSTNSSILGCITEQDDLLVVKTRRWRSYMLADGHCSTGDIPDGPPRLKIGARALLDFFEDLREKFQSELAPP